MQANPSIIARMWKRLFGVRIFALALVFSVPTVLAATPTQLGGAGTPPQQPTGTYFWNVIVNRMPVKRTTVLYYNPEGELIKSEVFLGRELDINSKKVVTWLNRRLKAAQEAYEDDAMQTVYANLEVRGGQNPVSILRLYDRTTHQLVFERLFPGEALQIGSKRVKRLFQEAATTYAEREHRLANN